MGKLLMLTNNASIEKRTIKPELKIGPVSLTFIICVLACIIALFYLYQANDAAIKGYEIKKLEDEKAEIMQEREKLMIEAASLQSIKNIESQKNLVPTKQINYWSPTQVASK